MHFTQSCCRWNGKCIFNNDCRKSFIIYEAKCNICHQRYIGNTQQHFKKRISQHIQDTCRLVNKGEASDTFADHFAKHCSSTIKGNLRPKHVREMLSLKILWEGNPIHCMKSFNTHGCNLCMKERLEILKAKRLDKLNGENILIKESKDFYGACRHKTKFHRYHKF